MKACIYQFCNKAIQNTVHIQTFKSIMISIRDTGVVFEAVYL